MTDDEAFVRAVVDHPGDDTPRLVYADWLEEHDQAQRAAYLRAEAAVRTGKGVKKLRVLAAGLDPVWTARVSRPPFGVCADRMVVSPAGPPLTTADLDAAEAELGVALPAHYRAFLLNWNGGFLSLNQPPQPRFRYGISEVQSLFYVSPAGVERSEQPGDGELFDLVTAFGAFCDPEFVTGDPNDRPMGDYLPIGMGGDGDYYLIGVRGTAAGQVGFFHDYTHHSGELEHLGVVALSVGRFLADLVENAPEWYRLVKNGDLPGLVGWLDAGGDVNARDADRQESLLEAAVGSGNAAMVKELLGRKARVTKGVRELAGMMTGPEGRQVRAALGVTKPARGKKS